MSRLVWGQTNQKRHESGVERGVFYPPDGPGVVWNGLISVEESFSGGETASYHFDGVKYLDKASPRTYQSTITAFSAPKEFGEAVGERAVIPGFILTRQPRVRFGLTYRTMVNESDYKLHLVYNALASANGRGYSSLNASPSPGQFSWTIDAVPPLLEGYRPSAHFVLNSLETPKDAMMAVETILYGSDDLVPRLLGVEELIDLIGLWTPLAIEHDSVGGLSQLVSGTGDLYKTRVDGIHRALPNTRLNKSPINGLYRME